MSVKHDDAKYSDLHQKMIEFNRLRGWHPSVQDLAKSIVIEAAELLELYQWDGSGKKLDVAPQPKDMDKVASEAADVFIYLSSFCRTAGINILDAVDAKIKHNEEKYPASMFNGHHNDDFYQRRKLEYRQNKK